MTFRSGLRKLSKRLVPAVLLVFLFVILAIRFYYVQEVIAALAIFSLLFAVVAAAVLVIYLIDRARQRTLDWAEPHATHMTQAAGELLAKPGQHSEKKA